LGMFNQFYALVLLMYRNLRKGDLAGAVFDGGLWLIFLPGLVLLLLNSQMGGPAIWSRLALGMITVGGVGLVLTQGRKETTFLGKAITGVVSLYGILGSYGTTSFIGDTLSYSRLLALGLTTVIVGQSANMIAGLTLSWGAIGLLVFLVIVVFGHTGNFLISILGAFVHSARLIFVEFFTKFYDGGARPFAPLGAPKQVRITED
jgi:V/A-type H+/Na+-transporting ATPase subunit I